MQKDRGKNYEQRAGKAARRVGPIFATPGLPISGFNKPLGTFDGAFSALVQASLFRALLTTPGSRRVYTAWSSAPGYRHVQPPRYAHGARERVATHTGEATTAHPYSLQKERPSGTTEKVFV